MPPVIEETITCLDDTPDDPPAKPPVAPAGSPPTRPVVVWTHRAEHQLDEESTQAHIAHPGGEGPLTPAQLGDELARAYWHARELIVLDVYRGFRPRRSEYILLVDVRDDDAPGTYIVKLADHARLQKELDAWSACRPPGFRGDCVFMGLRPRHDRDTGQLLAVAYQDAKPHIGAGETVWLEAAALRAVQFGAPALGSVFGAVGDLYTQLGRVLYGASVPAPLETAATGIELNARGSVRRKLCDAFRWWDPGSQDRVPGAVRVRRLVNTALTVGPDRYRDPVDYLDYLEKLLRRGAPAEQVLPRRLRGKAHGDLHGRNVQVGVERNRIDSPALYDYEDMSRDNLIGWDFVKLETELKIRALEQLGAQDAPDMPGGDVPLDQTFVERVERFEAGLAERTYRYNRGAWPDPTVPSAPLARLAELVLFIRRQAKTHLGTNRGRAGEWLHEYLFLLACYGVTTGKFELTNDRPRAAALVSAGVAAAQYHQGIRVATPTRGNS
jgi:hypothetical protein